MKTRALLLLTPLALLAASDPAAADILPPGTKGVRHELVLEVSDECPGYSFLAYPTSPQKPPEGGVLVIEPGKPFSFYKLSQPRIYAVQGAPPDLEKLTPEWFEAPDRARSKDTLKLVSTVPEDSPVARILTVYRVTAVKEGKVILSLVREDRLDADGKPVSALLRPGGEPASTLLPVSLAAALAGLALISRRRQDVL